MQAAAAQSVFLLATYAPWYRDLADRHCAHQPTPGAKTAGWLIGHLVVTGDYARRLCGLPPLAPKEWRPLFAPGSLPGTDPAGYPPMAQLLACMSAVYADLAARAPGASAEALEAPNPFAPARDAFPTAGAFVAYLLTGHLGYHLGQLAIWRAVAAGAYPELGA